MRLKRAIAEPGIRLQLDLLAVEELGLVEVGLGQQRPGLGLVRESLHGRLEPLGDELIAALDFRHLVGWRAVGAHLFLHLGPPPLLGELLAHLVGHGNRDLGRLFDRVAEDRPQVVLAIHFGGRVACIESADHRVWIELRRAGRRQGREEPGQPLEVALLLGAREGNALPRRLAVGETEPRQREAHFLHASSRLAPRVSQVFCPLLQEAVGQLARQLGVEGGNLGQGRQDAGFVQRLHGEPRLQPPQGAAGVGRERRVPILLRCALQQRFGRKLRLLVGDRCRRRSLERVLRVAMPIEEQQLDRRFPLGRLSFCLGPYCPQDALAHLMGLDPLVGYFAAPGDFQLPGDALHELPGQGGLLPERAPQPGRHRRLRQLVDQLGHPTQRLVELGLADRESRRSRTRRRRVQDRLRHAPGQHERLRLGRLAGQRLMVSGRKIQQVRLARFEHGLGWRQILGGFRQQPGIQEQPRGRQTMRSLRPAQAARPLAQPGQRDLRRA